VRETVDVCVVGGGISGLAAAHVLHQKGASFLLLEGSERWGGVIRTERAGGFLFEAGPDSFLAAKEDALRLCEELGIESRLIPTNPVDRTVFILVKGVLHPLPDGMFLAVPTRIRPFLTSGLFSWKAKLRMGLDLLMGNGSGEADESIASFLRRRFGEESVVRLGEPLLAGIHAGDPESLSMRATFPRFVDMERRNGSVILGMWRASRRAPKQPSGFLSFEGGLSEFVEALVQAIPEPRRRLGATVSRLARVDGGFAVEFGADSIEARRLVLAIPASRAGELLGGLDPALAEPLKQIRFASTATVLLGYQRRDVGHSLRGYGLLVPRTEGLRTNACTFVSTKFPGRAPPGHVLLRGFLGGARDPRVLEEDDRGLIRVVEDEMGPVLGLQGKPTVANVYRWPGATPQLEVGHEARIRSIEETLRKERGLFLTGAGLRVTGIPDCIGDVRRAASDSLASL
jgi:oxygen-dependent protoporphyrinogen oxidase